MKSTGNTNTDIRAAYNYVIDGKLVQAYWRGNHGFPRTVPIINGNIKWGSATDWKGPFPHTALPGSGDIQAQSTYTLGNKLFQEYWRGNELYYRNIPIINGKVQWGAAPSFSGPISVNVLPGSGDMQARSTYVLGNRLHQAYWRGNKGYYRSVPIVNGKVQWGSAPAYNGPTLLSNLPGSGDIQSTSNYVLGNKLHQKICRGNVAYSRAVPIVNNQVQWGTAPAFNGPIALSVPYGPGYVVPDKWKPNGDRLQDFSIFEYDGYFYISALWKDNPSAGLRYARSTDMKNWEDLGLILKQRTPEGPDENMIWAPHVFEYNGTYFQYFTGVKGSYWEQSIMLATTTTPNIPESWQKVAINGTIDGAFRPTHTGANWTAGQWADCRDPMVFFAEGKWHMYYTGSDSSVGGIAGHAVSDYPNGPWQDLGAVISVSSGIPESVFVIKSPGGQYLLNYNHAAAGKLGGAKTAYSSSPSGPFVKSKSLNVGWAHEFIKPSNSSDYIAAYLTGYWVNMAPIHWSNNNNFFILSVE